MRPEWTDAEKGEAAGIAHHAAFSTVCEVPDGGWRNSYDERDDPEMAAAHTAAHRAMEDYPRRPRVPPFTPPLAWDQAWRAIQEWDTSGRPLRCYEHHVPRQSAASAANGDGNPLQHP